MKERNKEAIENPEYTGKVLKISRNPVSERILDHKNLVYRGKVLQPKKQLNSGKENIIRWSYKTAKSKGSNAMESKIQVHKKEENV